MKKILTNSVIISAALCLQLSAFSLPALAVSAFAEEGIVAVVNNEIITQKDVDDFENFMRVQLSSEYKGRELEKKIQSMETDLLEKLIEDRLIISEAKKNNLKVDENRIKARISDIKRQYPSEDEFQKSLQAQGMVQADLEARIKEQMLMYSIIDNKIKSRIVISPSEVTEYYRKKRDDFKTPSVWELESIAVEDMNLALDIYNKLKSGYNFDTIVGKYSLAKNKLSMSKGELKKDIEDIIIKLKPQDVSVPVKIEEKYYILKLIKVIPGRQMSLAESQDDIHNLLLSVKMQETMEKWIGGLKKQSYIKILKGS